MPLRNKEGVIKSAEKMKALDPSIKDQMDTIIDLTNKGDWNILDTL